MTIASAITAAQGRVADAYTAISNKGGTLPATQNLANMPTAIASIPTGGGVGIPREVKNGVFQMPTEDFTFSLPSGATKVGAYGMAYAFYAASHLKTIDLSSLTASGGNQGFYYAFASSGATSIDISNLVTITHNSYLYGFLNSCYAITSITFDSLTTATGSDCLSNAMGYCQYLETVRFPVLSDLSGSRVCYRTFYQATRLKDVYFNALTTTSFGNYVNQFTDTFAAVASTSGAVTVHFPSNLSSTISGLTGYPNFGATTGRLTLAFDLPATS